MIVGPDIGEDAAVIAIGDRCLVVATDPITFAAEHIGSYAVHVNANDVAVLGARPRWFFAVLLLPERGTTPALVDSIMADMARACDAAGITIAGGHTEITHGLDRPIVIGQMIGDVEAARIVRKERVAVGDQILLTRGIAIEGTAILARELPARLRERIDADLIARAARFLVEPGISVVDAAHAVVEAAGEAVHAMHDPTEGGLTSGIVELVAPARLGCAIVRERIRVFPETDAICAALALDPMKLIASGALLVAVAPGAADKVLGALDGIGVPADVIGDVRPADDGLAMVTAGRPEPLIAPDRDEIARAFT